MALVNFGGGGVFLLSSSAVLILSSFEYMGCQSGVCEWLCLGFGTRKRKIGLGDETRRLILFFNHNDSSELLLFSSVGFTWDRRDETCMLGSGG